MPPPPRPSTNDDTDAAAAVALRWQEDFDSLMKSSMTLFDATTPLLKSRPNHHHSNHHSSGNNRPVCHGRVKDLESMVPRHWWKTVFADAMYLKTDGDVVEDPEITREEIAMLEADADIKAVFNKGADDPCGEESVVPARILDLCCGQGRHSLFLAKEYPHLVLYGHDQSSYLISLAQERASFQNLTANTFFTVGDCRQIPYEEEKFDLAMVMGNSFGYFSEYDDEGDYETQQSADPAKPTGTNHSDLRVLREIHRVLAPGGKLILDLTDGDYMRENFAERSWEWIDDGTFVCRERQLSKDRLRLVSREVITSTTKGVIRDQFYQERLYGLGELSRMLRGVGFEVSAADVSGGAANTAPAVVVPAESDPHRAISVAKELSKRNEDLGMMERRILIKAIKPLDDASSAASEESIEANKETLSVDSDSDKNVKLDSAIVMDDDSAVTTLETALAVASKPIVKAAQKEQIPPPPFPEITVMVGDANRPCFGKLNNTWNPEDLETRQKLLNSLLDLGYTSSQIKVVDDHSTMLKDLWEMVQERRNHNQRDASTPPPPPMFVFNLCDEGFDNDALKELHIPAVLDMLEIPYSGAGANCLAICYDKGLVNRTADALGVPTPRETYYLADIHGVGDEAEYHEQHQQQQSQQQETEQPTDAQAQADADERQIDRIHHTITERIQYPAFIKPLRGDNSLGITARSIVRNRQELREYLVELRDKLGIRDVIVQEYLEGTEYGVGMIGNLKRGERRMNGTGSGTDAAQDNLSDFHFFPVLEVDYSSIIESSSGPPILGYESKWDPTSPYWTDIKYKRAKMTKEKEEELKRYCVVLWERFGCRDYARFDFRCDWGTGNGFEEIEVREEVDSQATLQDSSSTATTTSSSLVLSPKKAHRKQTIKLLEVNPNPGWCWDGKLTYMAKLEGYEYKDVVRMILQAAWDRLNSTQAQ
ncbi:hypothetical protein HK102_001092 [Quaeritorhiza haematococci]|nr:hypothetical protein HK102_001092 [Quaeritorhiza haematococci]